MAYNGVQRSAKETVLKNDLSSARTQLALAIVETGKYPADLTAAVLKSSGDTKYQYTVNNNAAPPTYCLTAVSSSMIGTAYRATQDETAVKGSCSGHSTNPGYTNLVANSSAEVSSGNQVIRTNLATDPRAAAVPVSPAAGFLGWRSSRWFGGGSGAGTYTSLTGATPLGNTTFARKTWTVQGSTNGDTGFDHTNGNTSAFPITSGQQVVASSYLRPSTSKWAAVFMTFYDSAGASIGGRYSSSAVLLSAGQWTRVSHTLTAPVGATYMYVSSDITGNSASGATLWATGDTLDGTGLLVEQSTAIGDYFDGSTTAVGDFTYNWTGTAGSSASEQRGLSLVGYSGTTNYTYPTIFQSTSWSSSGAKSIGMINRGAHTDQFFNLDNAAYIFQPNKTYTLIAKVKTTKAISDPNQLRLRYNITGVGDRSVVSGITGPVGEYDFRVVFDTNGMTGNVNFFRPMNAVSDPGLITYWDSFAIVEGTYTGPYFE